MPTFSDSDAKTTEEKRNHHASASQNDLSSDNSSNSHNSQYLSDIHAWPLIVYDAVRRTQLQRSDRLRAGKPTALHDSVIIPTLSHTISKFIIAKARTAQLNNETIHTVSSTTRTSTDSMTHPQGEKVENSLTSSCVLQNLCCVCIMCNRLILQHSAPPRHPSPSPLPPTSSEPPAEVTMDVEETSIIQNLPAGMSIHAFVRAAVESLPSMIHILTQPFGRYVSEADKRPNSKPSEGSQDNNVDNNNNNSKTSKFNSVSRPVTDNAVHTSLVSQLLLFAQQASLTVTQWPLLVRVGIGLVTFWAGTQLLDAASSDPSSNDRLSRKMAEFVLTAIPVVVQILFPELWVFLINGALVALVHVYQRAQKDAEETINSAKASKQKMYAPSQSPLSFPRNHALTLSPDPSIRPGTSLSQQPLNLSTVQLHTQQSTLHLLQPAIFVQPLDPPSTDNIQQFLAQRLTHTSPMNAS